MADKYMVKYTKGEGGLHDGQVMWFMSKRYTVQWCIEEESQDCYGSENYYFKRWCYGHQFQILYISTRSKIEKFYWLGFRFVWQSQSYFKGNHLSVFQLFTNDITTWHYLDFPAPPPPPLPPHPEKESFLECLTAAVGNALHLLEAFVVTQHLALMRSTYMGPPHSQGEGAWRALTCQALTP